MSKTVNFSAIISKDGLRLCCDDPSFKIDHIPDLYDFKYDELGNRYLRASGLMAFVFNLYLSGRLHEEDVLSGVAMKQIVEALNHEGFIINKEGDRYVKDRCYE